MKILLPLAVVTALLLFYALYGREWLKSKPWAGGFFALVEPIEIVLFKKSETVLFGRLLQLLGAILTALTWLGSIDITPVLPLVPEKYAGIVQAVFSFMPLILNGLGAIVERLRNRTTKPLELVAVTEAEAQKPAVAAVLEAADVVKAKAIAIVEAEKAA